MDLCEGYEFCCAVDGDPFDIALVAFGAVGSWWKVDFSAFDALGGC